MAATALRPFAAADPDTARLQLSPDGSGRVDGAWWPRSDDLTAEVPGLAAALESRLGAVERVAYHPAAWALAPRRAGAGRAAVRFGAFRTQDPGVVDVSGATVRLTLLVVPADAPATVAAQIMEAATRPGSTGTVESLLAPYRAAASG